MLLLNCFILLFASASAIPYVRDSKVPRLDGRIVGGVDVTIEEYPYQISLLYYGSHICGGSLVNPRTVVTAAHCTAGFDQDGYSVRAGSSILNDGGVVVDVDKILQHPDFDRSTLDNDVTVIKLAEPLELSDSINFIGLVRANYTIPQDSVAICTGWGALQEGGPLPENLQGVSLPMVSNEDCNNYYGGGITPRMICAGNVAIGGIDACQGDSGGPMALDDNLIGIVSWGYGCARPFYPGVYSSVSALRQYIGDMMEKN